MSSPLRVVHYVNQFFGGIGGEEAANVGVSLEDTPAGAGRALQQALGDAGSVAGMLVCGDNYFNEREAEAVAAIKGHLEALQPDILVAGPAFGSGRYGLACAEVCKTAQGLGIQAVTGMHPDNPGAMSGWPDVLMVPTGETSADMPQALAAMVRLAGKLGRGEALGPAEADGYMPRGVRRVHDPPAPRLPARPRHAAGQAQGPAVPHRGAHPRAGKGEPGGAHRRPAGRYHRHGHHRRAGAQGQPGQAGGRQRQPLLPPLGRRAAKPFRRRLGGLPRRLFQPHRQRQPQLHPAPQLPARPWKPTARSAASSAPSTRCRGSPRRSPCRAIWAAASRRTSPTMRWTAVSWWPREAPAIVAVQRSPRKSSAPAFPSA